MPMNRYLEQYKAKQCTVDDALAAIRDGDFVATSGGVNAPLLFYKNLHRIAPRLRKVLTSFTEPHIKKGILNFWTAWNAKRRYIPCPALFSPVMSGNIYGRAMWTMCQPTTTARGAR